MSPEQPSSKIGKSVGEKLRAARIGQHYTQSQLAAPDFSVSYISAIERGQIHPSLRALEILATRLGLTSTQLLPARSQQDERLSAAINHAERDDNEIELELLNIHMLIIQDNATQAVEQLEKFSIKRLKRPQLLQQRYLMGWSYYKAGRYQESENMLAEGVQIAKELNNNYLNLRILNQLALTYIAMRNYAQALLAHQRVLELLENTEPHDPFFTVQICIQLGQHYTRLENFGQALEMFNKALAITEGLSSVPDIQAAYARLSNYYATEKNNDLAKLYAYKGEQIQNQESMKRLKSQLHHFLGHAIMQGDQEKARIYLDEALATPNILQDKLALASIYTRNAEWYFARKEWEEAKKYAELGHNLTQELGDTIIAAEALIVMGRIEYAQQSYESGSKHFVAGLDMFERLGSHQELADESVRYAQLLEEIGNEREAFTHFRRAFQSKQKLGK